MNPISNLSQLIETLRLQMSPRLERAGTHGKKNAKTGNGPAHKTKHASANELQSTLAQRIKAIAPDDKRKRQKSMRIFLETVLVNEFGDAFLADPGFAEMVDEIQATMEGDEQIRSHLDSLFAQLAK